MKKKNRKKSDSDLTMKRSVQDEFYRGTKKLFRNRLNLSQIFFRFDFSFSMLDAHWLNAQPITCTSP